MTDVQEDAVPSLFTISRAPVSADESHDVCMRTTNDVVNNTDVVHGSMCEQASGAGPRRMPVLRPNGVANEGVLRTLHDNYLPLAQQGRDAGIRPSGPMPDHPQVVRDDTRAMQSELRRTESVAIGSSHRSDAAVARDGSYHPAAQRATSGVDGGVASTCDVRGDARSRVLEHGERVTPIVHDGQAVVTPIMRRLPHRQRPRVMRCTGDFETEYARIKAARAAEAQIRRMEKRADKAEKRRTEKAAREQMFSPQTKCSMKRGVCLMVPAFRCADRSPSAMDVVVRMSQTEATNDASVASASTSTIMSSSTSSSMAAPTVQATSSTLPTSSQQTNCSTVQTDRTVAVSTAGSTHDATSVQSTQTTTASSSSSSSSTSTSATAAVSATHTTTKDVRASSQSARPLSSFTSVPFERDDDSILRTNDDEHQRRLFDPIAREQALRDVSARQPDLVLNRRTGPVRPTPLTIEPPRPHQLVISERSDSPCGGGLRQVQLTLTQDGTYARRVLSPTTMDDTQTTDVKTSTTQSPTTNSIWRDVKEISSHQFEKDHIVQYACMMKTNGDAAVAWATERELAVCPQALFAYLDGRSNRDLEDIATIEKMRRQQLMTNSDGDETDEREMNKRFPPSLAERRWRIRSRAILARAQERAAKTTSISTKTTTTTTPTRASVSVDVTNSNIGTAMSVAMSSGVDVHAVTPSTVSSTTLSSLSSSSSSVCGSAPTTTILATTPTVAVSKAVQSDVPVITTTSSMTTAPGVAPAEASTTTNRNTTFSASNPHSVVFIDALTRKAVEQQKLSPLSEKDEPNQWIRTRTTNSESLVHQFQLAWKRPEVSFLGVSAKRSPWTDELLTDLMEKSGKATHGTNASQRRIQSQFEHEELARFIVGAGVIADEDTKMTTIAAIVAAPMSLWPTAFDCIEGSALTDLIMNRWRHRSGAARKIRVFSTIVGELLQRLWTNFYSQPASERRRILLEYNQRQFMLFNQLYDEELRWVTMQSRLDNTRLLTVYPYLQAAGMLRYADILSLEMLQYLQRKLADGEDVTDKCATIVACIIRRGADIHSFLNRKKSQLRDLTKTPTLVFVHRDLVREDLLHNAKAFPPTGGEAFAYRDVLCGYNWKTMPDSMKAWGVNDESREWPALWANAEGRIGDCPSREALVARWQLELQTNAHAHNNCPRNWPSAGAKERGDHLCRFGVMDDPTFFDSIDVHRRRDGRRTEYRVLYKKCAETSSFDPQWRTDDEAGMPALLARYNATLTQYEVAGNTKHTKRNRRKTTLPRMGTPASFPTTQTSSQPRRRAMDVPSSSDDDSEASTPVPSEATTPVAANTRRMSTPFNHQPITVASVMTTPTRTQQLTKAVTPVSASRSTKPTSNVPTSPSPLMRYPVGSVLKDTRNLLPAVRILSEAERALALATHINANGDVDHIVNAIIESRRNDAIWRSIDSSIETSDGSNRTVLINTEYERRMTNAMVQTVTKAIVNQSRTDVHVAPKKPHVVTNRSKANSNEAGWLHEPLLKCVDETIEQKSGFNKEWIRNDVFSQTHDVELQSGKPMTPAAPAALTNTSAPSDDRRDVSVCGGSVGRTGGALPAPNAVRTTIDDGRDASIPSSCSDGARILDGSHRSASCNDDRSGVLAGTPADSLDKGRTVCRATATVGDASVQARNAETRHDDTHSQTGCDEQARSVPHGRMATQSSNDEQSVQSTSAVDRSDVVRNRDGNHANADVIISTDRSADTAQAVGGDMRGRVDGRMVSQSIDVKHAVIRSDTVVSGRTANAPDVATRADERVREDIARAGVQLATPADRTVAAVTQSSQASDVPSRPQSTPNGGQTSARHDVTISVNQQRAEADVATTDRETRQSNAPTVRRHSIDVGSLAVRSQSRGRSIDCDEHSDETSATGSSTRTRSKSQAPTARRVQFVDDDHDDQSVRDARTGIVGIDSRRVRQRLDDANVERQQQSDDAASDGESDSSGSTARSRLRSHSTSGASALQRSSDVRGANGGIQHVPLGTDEQAYMSVRGSDRQACGRMRVTTRKYVRDYNDCDSIEQISRKKEFLDSIETYTGKTNINDWLDVYSNYAWLANIPENVAASWIFSKLKGAAKEWAKSPDVRNLGDMSWKDVVKSLRERFESADARGTRATQLFHRELKPDETLVQFAEDMYRLRSVAFGENAQAQFSDSNLIDMLISKLDKYFRYQLRSKEVNTWTKLKHELRLLDDVNGKETRTVLYPSKHNRDDTRRERDNTNDVRARGRGRFDQHQRRPFNNYSRFQSDESGPRQTVAMYTPVGVPTNVAPAISMAPPMNTVLCVQPSAMQSNGTVQPQALQQAPMTGMLNSNAPVFQPNAPSSGATQPNTNLRRCKFCWEQGWGECFHRSWRDCPYKIMQRSQNAHNGQPNNGGPQSDVQTQPHSANAVQQGARPSHFNPNSQRRQDNWRHKRGRGPENNPQDNRQQQQQSSQPQSGQPNGAPPMKMFRAHLVLRIGTHKFAGIENGQRGLRDVRRILTARAYRRPRAPAISEEKMERVVRQFIDADPRAFDETTYASLNACVSNDLADAWMLDVTNNQFLSLDSIKTLLTTPISAPEAQGRLIIPRWSDVVGLRRLLNDKRSDVFRVGLVIPLTLLPIFEDQRIDIPILLSRARNLFSLSAVTTRCGITRLAPCGNAEKLFRRSTWIAILVSNDKRRCMAFARAFGEEEAASIEQLRMHMRILKHAAYLPGYEALADIQEVDESVAQSTPNSQTHDDASSTVNTSYQHK